MFREKIMKYSEKKKTKKQTIPFFWIFGYLVLKFLSFKILNLGEILEANEIDEYFINC